MHGVGVHALCGPLLLQRGSGGGEREETCGLERVSGGGCRGCGTAQRGSCQKALLHRRSHDGSLEPQWASFTRTNADITQTLQHARGQTVFEQCAKKCCNHSSCSVVVPNFGGQEWLAGAGHELHAPRLHLVSSCRRSSAYGLCSVSRSGPLRLPCSGNQPAYSRSICVSCSSSRALAIC